MSKIIGIYLIKNTINDKIYVGSSDDIDNRWRNHKTFLANNNHHSIHLQNAWQKYGERAFIFEIIELISDKERLLEREQYYLDLYCSYEQENGYNISKFSFSPMKGRKHTEETKKHLSINNSGDKHWAYGKHLSEEHKNKISSIKRKISKEQEKEVLEYYKKLENGYEVAKLYDVHAETIYRILRRHGIANPRQK